MSEESEWTFTTIKELIGKTFKQVIETKGSDGDDELHFLSYGKTDYVLIETEGKDYAFYHPQDCCESVYIESITGDLSDLIGSPILKAEERTRWTEENESTTYTFYEFSTIKGSVTVRWIGNSNGYYSESVYFKEI